MAFAAGFAVACTQCDVIVGQGPGLRSRTIRFFVASLLPLYSLQLQFRRGWRESCEDCHIDIRETAPFWMDDVLQGWLITPHLAGAIFWGGVSKACPSLGGRGAVPMAVGYWWSVRNGPRKVTNMAGRSALLGCVCQAHCLHTPWRLRAGERE
tara:strand:- start:11196 stop:11654 length:459 start_codon:yes stop_codon:yes gene_type:complete